VHLDHLHDFRNSDASSDELDLVYVFNFKSSLLKCSVDWLGNLFEKFFSFLFKLFSWKVILKSDVIQELWNFDISEFVCTKSLLDIDGFLE
jgi:hypothetical protein